MMKSADTIFDEALKMARVSAQRKGLSIGQSAIHTCEDIGCVLKEIRGDMAVIWKGTTDTEKRVPLKELADPDKVCRLVRYLRDMQYRLP